MRKLLTILAVVLAICAMPLLLKSQQGVPPGYFPGAQSSGTAPWNCMIAACPVAPPVLSTLTWGNQGNATATYNAGGGLYMAANRGSVPSQPILYKAVPATPWTLTIGFIPGSNGVSSPGSGSIDVLNAFAGLIMRESATGKMVSFEAGTSAGNLSFTMLAGCKYASYTNFGFGCVISQASFLPPVLWYQVTVDSTNITYSTAVDGQNFKPILVQAKNTYFTTGPDEAGITVEPGQAGFTFDAVFVHWSGI